MPQHDGRPNKYERIAKFILQGMCIGGMVVCAVAGGSDIPFIVYASLAAGFLGVSQLGELLDKFRSGK